VEDLLEGRIVTFQVGTILEEVASVRVGEEKPEGELFDEQIETDLGSAARAFRALRAFLPLGRSGFHAIEGSALRLTPTIQGACSAIAENACLDRGLEPTILREEESLGPHGEVFHEHAFEDFTQGMDIGRGHGAPQGRSHLWRASST
jgi:hypothetical protein